MTAAVVFEPATRADEPALRALLRATPMPGAVRLVQTREPDFFAADAVLGDRVDTLVARERPGGPPVAVLQRAERRVWWQGAVVTAAYLGGLRVHPAHRGRGVARAGWAAVAAWQRARPAALTYCALTAENHAARRIFVEAPGGAAAWARFAPLADVRTLALPVPRRAAEARPRGAAAAGPVSPRDLAPADDPGETRGDPARPGAANPPTVWDPSAVRQTRIAGYGGGLRLARPLASAALRLLGRPGLPPAGGVLRSGVLVGREAADAPALDALLDAALARCRLRGLDWLLVGFDALDPLLPVAARRPHVAYRSALHALVWPGEPAPAATRPVHVDLARL